MKQQPIVVAKRIQPTGMKEQPIVVLDRIRLTVVLDRIRPAVSVKRIRRVREANGEAGKNEWHHSAGRHHRGKRPMLFFLADAAGWDFRGEVEAVDGLGERRMTEGLSA